MLVAPGLEHEEGESFYMTRVGTAYEFKFTGWSLAPEQSLVDVTTAIMYIGHSLFPHMKFHR